MAASGASRASSSRSNGLPSAKRPLIFALPRPRRKKAAAARPANKPGFRAGAKSVPSPWMRRSVPRGVPISRPTACSASSSRAPGSTKVLVPPPSAASRRKKPSFTAVSMPTVNTRASPSSDCSRLSTLEVAHLSVREQHHHRRPRGALAAAAKLLERLRHGEIELRSSSRLDRPQPLLAAFDRAFIRLLEPAGHPLDHVVERLQREPVARPQRAQEKAQARAAEAIFGPCIDPERSSTKT